MAAAYVLASLNTVHTAVKVIISDSPYEARSYGSKQHRSKAGVDTAVVVFEALSLSYLIWAQTHDHKVASVSFYWEFKWTIWTGRQSGP